MNGFRLFVTCPDEGLIDSDREVTYPFGYGLPYTSFSQTMGTISESNGSLAFSVTVTNTGNTAGKDVMEVCFNPPIPTAASRRPV